ncbi:MAG: hypothetical protein J6K88_00845 [Oscillospiraceae bacterium]|nr:hypothetical protein [Oscillospiraceae bacterium]
MAEYTRKKWDKDWKMKAWEACLQKISYRADIAFLGDSITHLSQFQKDFPDKEIISLGVPGYPVAAFWEYVQMLKASGAEKVFIMGGINGLKDDNIDEIVADYKALLDYINEEVPERKFYIQSALPVTESAQERYCQNTSVRIYNEKLKALAKEYGATYIELHKFFLDEKENLKENLTGDGVHPLPAVYKKWAEEIKPYIYE